MLGVYRRDVGAPSETQGYIEKFVLNAPRMPPSIRGAARGIEVRPLEARCWHKNWR